MSIDIDRCLKFIFGTIALIFLLFISIIQEGLNLQIVSGQEISEFEKFK